MIRLSNLRLNLNYNDIDVKRAVTKELRIDEKAVESISLYRRSIDARRKNDVHYIATVDITLNSDENKVLSKAKCKNAVITEKYRYDIPFVRDLDKRPVIVGFGPAGMFCALILAQAGQRPIVIERGQDVDTRTQKVDALFSNRVLDTESNVQFGEGGAGTFSDGKLNTGTKDTRSRHVLNEFVRHGAPVEILYNAKPHIGTDKLKITVKNIREEIISLGGQVMFNTRLCAINHKDAKISSVTIEKDNYKEIIECDNVVLAIGHSARDTFEMLKDAGLIMAQKPFAIGARIEHLRENIDKAQYGEIADKNLLGAADYKMNIKSHNGRGVFTFCMCPGGVVVAAQSECDTVVTNGMSYFARDGINSNSALLVNVNPADFNSDDVLAGVHYQRKIERAAFNFGSGDYSAPIQRVGDFLNNRKSDRLGEVTPTYRPGYNFAELDDILPRYITDSMREGIVAMDRKLHGFAHHDALLTGAETRSSSPVRILRNDDLQSVNVQGIYPCGEGAGYAGGIISAAVDGIRCAEQILINA